MTRDVSKEQIDEVLVDLLSLSKASMPDDPRAYSEVAVRAQLSQAVLTGMQVKATLQLVEATNKATAALSALPEALKEATATTEVLSDIRNTLSSNL